LNSFQILIFNHHTSIIDIIDYLVIRIQFLVKILRRTACTTVVLFKVN